MKILFAPLAFMRMVPCLLILSDDGFLLFVDQMYRIKDPKRSSWSFIPRGWERRKISALSGTNLWSRSNSSLIMDTVLSN